MTRILIITGILMGIASACKTPVPTTNLVPIKDSVLVEPTFRYPEKDVSIALRNILKIKEVTGQQYSNKLESVLPIYASNNYLPLWTNDTSIQASIQVILGSTEHALNPKHYNFSVIDSLNKIYQTDSAEIVNRCVLLDFHITHGLQKLCKHLYYGLLNPHNYHSSWNYPDKPAINIDSLILSSAKSGQVDRIISLLEPQHPTYQYLKKELIKYQNDTFKYTSTKLKYPNMINRIGDSNKYVYELKKHLINKGEFPSSEISYKFDSTLLHTILKIQQRHGLTADGLPGIKTYQALNWDNKKYKNCLIANMERLRWYPEEPASSLTINIPEYRLSLSHSNTNLFNTRVIVGKIKNQTPVLHSKIDYVVFNPCWTVPHSIASEKMLPRIKKDSTYLDKRNMFITQNGKRVNHHEIDFSIYSKNNFPFKIFQNTDPGNALGKVKFMFHNGHSIYLHDTPSKHLFKKDLRAFSHGCVRIQDAQELARILVKDIDKNTRPLNYYYDKGYPEKVYLRKPIRLNIIYLTSNYNSKLKQIQFFSDIYNLDPKVSHDLNLVINKN